MALNFLRKIFSKTKTAGSYEPPRQTQNFKIIVTEFLDNVDENSGEIIAEILQKKEGISVHYFNQTFDKSFLNFDIKELFDWIDKGQSIADKTEAYVVVWGYREGERIRINFQSPNQYESAGKTFISLIDSLYIPAEYIKDSENFPEAISDLIYGGVLCAINTSSEFNPYRKYLLRKTTDKLLKDDGINSLISEYTPYIMNFLGLTYLSYAYESKEINDFKAIRNIFENAIKHQNKLTNQTHLGLIYYHLGQLYDSASQNLEKSSATYFKGAVEYYVQSQRYLSKYNHPYEYGLICYRLSSLYYSFWIRKSDSQALRDSVFQLREAEKVYTYAQFPEFWATIQANLGYLLSILGGMTNNFEISELAITSYKNKQKVTTEKEYPTSWARTQNDIGDVYYRQGKAKENVELLEESLEYFHDALYIFETERNWSEVKNTSIRIAKTNEALSQIKYRE